MTPPPTEERPMTLLEWVVVVVPLAIVVALGVLWLAVRHGWL